MPCRQDRDGPEAPKFRLLTMHLSVIPQMRTAFPGSVREAAEAPFMACQPCRARCRHRGAALARSAAERYILGSENMLDGIIELGNRHPVRSDG